MCMIEAPIVKVLLWLKQRTCASFVDQLSAPDTAVPKCRDKKKSRSHHSYYAASVASFLNVKNCIYLKLA